MGVEVWFGKMRSVDLRAGGVLAGSSADARSHAALVSRTEAIHGLRLPMKPPRHSLIAAVLCIATFAHAEDATPEKESAPPAAPLIEVVEIPGGEFRFTVETTEAPDLTDWSKRELIPALQKWYPLIVAMLPSEGYTAPKTFSIVFTKVHLKEASPLGTAAGTLLMAAAALAGLVPFAPPPHPLASIAPMAWIAMLGLALVSTTVAFIFYYRLIADVGPVKAITVTLLVPVFGMIWGVVFLGEPVTPGRLAGCAIILAGCSLILGLARLPAPSTH